MKRAAARASALVVAAGLLAGCAELASLVPSGGIDRRQQARQLIAQGDLAEAAIQLRVLETLYPNDPEIVAQRRSVEAEAKRRAESHYEKAEAVAKRDSRAARKEYVAALAYDPRHEGALRRLRQLELQSNRSNRPRMGGPEAPTRMVEADRPARMAGQAAESRPPPRDVPLPLPKPVPPAAQAPASAGAPGPSDGRGAVAALRPAEVDRKDTGGPAPRPPVGPAIDGAKAGTYLNLIAYAESYLADHPEDDKAMELLALSHEKAGLALYRDGEFRQSLRHLEFAVAYTGDSEGQPAAALAAARSRLADETFELGVRAFREDVSKAIAYWEETLTFDPGHAKAKAFLSKAYRIRDTLQEISEP